MRPDLLKDMPQSFKDSTIAVAWEYNPQARGYDKYLTPFTKRGSRHGLRRASIIFERCTRITILRLRIFSGSLPMGKRLGSTGQLNTIWNDDGEGLFNQDWYGILFGAAAAWQKG